LQKEFTCKNVTPKKLKAHLKGLIDIEILFKAAPGI
jgi:hypothetical protein